MIYVVQKQNLLIADFNRQRLLQTLPFFNMTEDCIYEMKEPVEYGFIKGSIGHTAKKAEQIRLKRNALLLETDKYALADYPNGEIKEKYKIYRQALRDLTKQDGFPNNIVFPEVPE